MPATAIQRRDFTDAIAKECPGRPYPDVRDTCRSILRWAAIYSRLCEAACNGELTPGQKCQQETSEVRIQNLCICELSVSGSEIRAVFQRDPRGATVKLRMPSGKTDDLGEVGICVPTS